jgi:flagellar hook protein FlgE
VGTAVYGGARPDVCAIFAPVPACPNISWTYFLDTTAIADGTHTMAITATTVEGQSYTTSKQFSVANLGAPTGVRIGIDRPSATSGAFSGTAAIGGWAISDNAAINLVSIAVDGITVSSARYGGSRMDVCNAFPNRQGCPAVGWDALFDTTLYANGTHVLDVTAKDATGKTATESSTFTISN